MKKRVFPILVLALGATQVAQAQVNFIRMGMNAATLAKRASKNKAAEATPTSTYQGKTFPMMRTPAAELSGEKGAQIQAVETELDRCHSALLATANGLICTPEQLAALQLALRNLAKAKSTNMPAYQEEATFYLAENTRRQQAAASAPTTN